MAAVGDPEALVRLARGRLEVAGTIEGKGPPFGHMDLPAETATCDTDAIRLAGWALDNEGVARVTVWVLTMRRDAAQECRAAR
jgi:hypothetical protein